MNAFSPIVFGLFALLATPASAANFTGPVVSVLDGDTSEVLYPQATYEQIKYKIVAKQK